ncbi:MAG: hypothetical protein AB7H86_20800 [Blastocatellales bacterium]
MKKKPSESKKSPVPVDIQQNPEKQDVRAQKRLVTQNDLDQLVDQKLQQSQGRATESESDNDIQGNNE